MLSTAAFNALLKTLEEPPPHAIFILATTEVHKIPATVLSRCQRHEFRRIPVADIVAHLKALADEEGIQVEPEALSLVARQSTGAMRDAISLLDQLASSGQAISLELAQNVLGTAASQAVLNLIEALIARQPNQGLEQIHAALDAGSDPRQLARQVVDYLRDLLLIRMGNADQIDATPELRAQMARHAQGFQAPELRRVIRVFNTAANDARSAWQPALPLEMAYIEALEPPAGASPAEADSQPARGKSPGGSLTQAPAESRAAGQKPAAGASPPEKSALESQPVQPATHNDLTMKRVNENWRQIINLVGQQSKQTQALLNSCKPFGMKDGVLFLGFNGDFSKSKMEKDENIDIARKVIAQVLGVELPIRCFIATGNSASLPPEVDSDGMVAAALRDLGGEIVDVQ
jgi:DNA polymerase-3 subunit gamma/tau